KMFLRKITTVTGKAMVPMEIRMGFCRLSQFTDCYFTVSCQFYGSFCPFQKKFPKSIPGVFVSRFIISVCIQKSKDRFFKIKGNQGKVLPFYTGIQFF